MTKNINHRWWAMDLWRGSLIGLMTWSHAMQFGFFPESFWSANLPVAIGLIAFTNLLLIAGATGYIAYGHDDHPRLKVSKRLVKRLAMYLVGYYVVAVVANGVISNWQNLQIWQIVTFQTLVPFTEFIIVFLVLGLLKVLFRGWYSAWLRTPAWLVVLGISSYSLGTWLAHVPVSPEWQPWQLILAGRPGAYSFPLLQYYPVYLAGLWLGGKYYHLGQKQIASLVLKFGLLAVGIAGLALGFNWLMIQLPLIELLKRWPPSVLFIVSGTGLGLLGLWLLMKLDDLRNFPWSRTLLLLLGQNAFAIFLTHTLVLYLAKLIGFPGLFSNLIGGVAWLVSLWLALYLAKVIPLNWKFGLTLVDWCECQLGECTHARELSLVKRLKALLIRTFKVKDLFSVTLSGQRYRLFKKRFVVIGLVAVTLTAIPLGLAEHDYIVQEKINRLPGFVQPAWVLTTESKPTVRYQLPLPEDLTVDLVYYLVDGQRVGVMQLTERGWDVEIGVKQLPPGEYQIAAEVMINGDVYQTATTKLVKSAPLFVTWTIDWEGYDVAEAYLQAMEAMANQYALPMTQLFNPQIYVDETITEDRKQYLTAWVKRRQADYNDEIGLHLHMFPEFVEEAGVEPKLEPAWGGGWTEGYDILTSAYGTEEMIRIINHAKNLLAQQGFSQPLSYRAGGWYANEQTLKALEATDFLVDSSGRTAYSFGTNKVPGHWQLEATKQPYHPSTANQNATAPEPQLLLLEIPNNGGDTFAFSAAQMIDRFEQNFPGTFLEKPRQVTFLSHPHWFNDARQQKMQQVLTHVDRYSYEKGQGPVVYTTLMGVYNAWEHGGE
jgi:hypothetical protein